MAMCRTINEVPGLGFYLWSLLFFSAGSILKLVLFSGVKRAVYNFGLTPSSQQFYQMQALLSPPLARVPAKRLDLIANLSQSLGGSEGGWERLICELRKRSAPPKPPTLRIEKLLGPKGKQKLGYWAG